jgi:hypothetical protein
MKEYPTYDNSKVKIEVYSPSGELITVAMMNNQHDFYCPGLVPGQQYNLVFSYNDYFLMAVAFNCKESGKVVYLSPAHFLYNRTINKSASEFAKLIKSKYKIINPTAKPLMQWEKRLFEILAASGNRVQPQCLNNNSLNLYCAGNDLASKVR